MTKEIKVRVPVHPQTFRRYDRHTTEVTISGERFRLIAGQRPDGTLGQVTIGRGGRGSGAAGLLDGYATALSLGLGHGVPLTELLRLGLGLRFARTAAPTTRRSPEHAPPSTTAAGAWRSTGCPAASAPRSGSSPSPSAAGS